MENKKRLSIVIMTIFFISIMSSQTFITTATSSVMPIIDQFTSDKSIADVGEEVTFSIILSQFGGMAQYFSWNFRDGTINVSTTGTITHRFLYEGIYLVTGEAHGPNNITDIKTLKIIVQNIHPIIEDLIFPTEALEDQEVTFMVSNIIDSSVDLTILNYTWYLGDNQIFYNESFSTSFSQAGTYAVSLYVFDDQAALDLKTEFITIKNVKPKASFSIIPESLNNTYQEDEVLTFNATKSSDTISDVNNLHYYWNFQDGIVKKGNIVEHAFTSSGTYNVSLLVMDDDGAKDETWEIVLINNKPPTINLLDKNVTINEGDSFTFLTNSSDTLTDFNRLDYSWSSGKTGWEATELYLKNGSYTEAVTVSDPEGASDSDSMNIEVLNVPPQVSVFKAVVETNLTLKGWGTPNNTLCLYVFEDGKLLTMTSIISDWSYNESEPLSLTFDLTKNYQIIVNVTENEEAPPSWFNKATLKFEFADGSSWTSSEWFFELPCISQSEDPKQWILDPQDYLFKWPVTFKGVAFDPGADVLDVDVNFSISVVLDVNTFFWWLFPEHYETTYTMDENTTVHLESWRVGTDTTIQIDVVQEILDAHHDDPTSPAQVEFSALVRPVDLSFLSILDTCIFSNPILDVNVVEARNILDVSVKEDDGEEANVSIIMNTGQGVLDIENLAPSVDLHVPPEVVEGQAIMYHAAVSDLGGGNLTYSWNFGDGYTSTEEQPIHVFNHSGSYLVRLSVSDGALTTTRGKIVNVKNSVPYDAIQGNFEGVEDETLFFQTNIQDTPNDLESLRILWDLGDGYFSTGRKVEHSYATNGTYTLQLTIMDDNGEKAEILQ
ncbi:MAG: PKD domain-containing protein, partial [Candidatus Helarchaeota archaeon]